MKRTTRPPASAEMRLEAWLRAVAWLRGCGVEPVVPADIAWQLHEAYGLRVHGPVELWERAA